MGRRIRTFPLIYDGQCTFLLKMQGGQSVLPALLTSRDLSHKIYQERLGVLAAPREVRSTFLIAPLRSTGGFNL